MFELPQAVAFISTKSPLALLMPKMTFSPTVESVSLRERALELTPLLSWA